MRIPVFVVLASPLFFAGKKSHGDADGVCADLASAGLADADLTCANLTDVKLTGVVLAGTRP